MNPEIEVGQIWKDIWGDEFETKSQINMHPDTWEIEYDTSTTYFSANVIQRCKYVRDVVSPTKAGFGVPLIIPNKNLPGICPCGSTLKKYDTGLPTSKVEYYCPTCG